MYCLIGVLTLCFFFLLRPMNDIVFFSPTHQRHRIFFSFFFLVFFFRPPATCGCQTRHAPLSTDTRQTRQNPYFSCLFLLPFVYPYVPTPVMSSLQTLLNISLPLCLPRIICSGRKLVPASWYPQAGAVWKPASWYPQFGTRGLPENRGGSRALSYS